MQRNRWSHGTTLSVARLSFRDIDSNIKHCTSTQWYVHFMENIALFLEFPV